MAAQFTIEVVCVSIFLESVNAELRSFDTP